jgi:hypothetical protein
MREIPVTPLVFRARILHAMPIISTIGRRCKYPSTARADAAVEAKISQGAGIETSYDGRGSV